MKLLENIDNMVKNNPCDLVNDSRFNMRT